MNLHFYALKFGKFAKKQYLCSRFRAQRKRATKGSEIHWKMLMLKISHLQRKC